MNTTQKRLGGIFAATIVAALLVATVVLFQHHPGKNSAAAVPTTQPPTATPAPALHVTASQGWVYPSALNFGKSIAFAPNAPLTGYVCGNMSTQADAPLRFSVTHDGGATWHELGATPTKGVGCTMSIDPTDAADLLLLSYTHAGGEDTYRSHDAGQTWSPLLAPQGDGVKVDLGLPIWAGATLFVYANPDVADSLNINTVLTYTLAVSVNGGALTWVDARHVATPILHFIPSLGNGFAIGTTFYAYLSEIPNPCSDPKPNTSCPTARPTLVKTNDNGVTWTPYAPSSQVADIFGTLADGHTLMGQLFTSSGGISMAYSISTDAGQTWTTLPALPLGGSGGGTSAPDGTIYVLHSQGNSPAALLKLSPRATSWTTTAATIPGLGSSTSPVASVDGAGHPNAVWSTITSDGAQQPGIAYHAP